MQNLLVQSLRETLAAPGLEIVIAVTAALCGWIIGAEREKHEKTRRAADAGARLPRLRVVYMASYAFTDRGDASRVAAQIVSGIGFLGAGAILHGSGFISGMTTAGTIWVTAAIGLIAAAGHVAAALGSAIFVRLLHTGIYYWENRPILSVPAFRQPLDLNALRAAVRKGRHRRISDGIRLQVRSRRWERLIQMPQPLPAAPPSVRRHQPRITT